MKGWGKELEAYENGKRYMDNLSSALEIQCKKHPPTSSSDGICAHCLRDKLLDLLCPECGEQRLSSCSCSEMISSNSNIISAMAEVGSVGRISFLIENEKAEPILKLKQHKKESDNRNGETNLRRSSSGSFIDPKRWRKGSFWKMVMVFGRKRGKGVKKSEILVSDFIGVPRSRSACSFRGGSSGGAWFYETDQENGRSFVSSAPRISSFGAGFMMESGKRSCFSDSEARISNYDCETESSASVFSWKESRFIFDDPKFIDLKLEPSSKAKVKFSVLKKGGSSGRIRGLEQLESELGRSFGTMRSGTGSCRDSFGERDGKKCRKSHKMWRWLFKR